MIFTRGRYCCRCQGLALWLDSCFRGSWNGLRRLAGFLRGMKGCRAEVWPDGGGSSWTPSGERRHGDRWYHMLSVLFLLGCRWAAHVKGDSAFLLLIFLVLTPLCCSFLQDTIPSVFFIFFILLHVRQVVHSVLSQWAKTFSHYSRVWVQDGSQVRFGQLLPVVQCQWAWERNVTCITVYSAFNY